MTLEVCSPSVMRYSTIASSGWASRIDLAVSSNWSIGATRLDPAETEVASTARVSAQLLMAGVSGVSGTSKVPEAPNRRAAKLAFG